MRLGSVAAVSLGGADPDATLVERLRAGEQAAFAELVERYSGAVMRLARVYVPSTAVAEEVVQETWLGVLRGLERFEGRSSFRTWVFQIALNQARTRGERERRTVPFASLADREVADDAPAVDPERFLGADHDRWPHHWATPPQRWDESPERHAESAETLAPVRRRSSGCRPRSASSSRCATCTGANRPRSVTLWTSRRPISGSSSTAPAPACAPSSRPTSPMPELPEMPCRELVEVITDYLEDALPTTTACASRRTWPSATPAATTSSSSSRRSRSPAASRPRAAAGHAGRAAERVPRLAQRRAVTLGRVRGHTRDMTISPRSFAVVFARSAILAGCLMAAFAASAAAISPSFEPPAALDIAGSASSVAAGDFDGDGRKDLAAAYGLGPGAVSVWLGTGNPAGAFAHQSPDVTVGVRPGALVARDFNGDGRDDLAVANAGPPGDGGDDDVSILLGSPSGLVRGETLTVRDAPNALDAGDLDGDGDLDLVVANTAPARWRLPRRTSPCSRGNGTGHFEAAHVAVGCQPSGVAIADLTADAGQELGVACIGPAVVRIFAPAGGGLHQVGSDHPACEDTLVDLAAGNFDGLGKADLAVTCSGPGSRCSAATAASPPCRDRTTRRHNPEPVFDIVLPAGDPEHASWPWRSPT